MVKALVDSSLIVGGYMLDIISPGHNMNKIIVHPTLKFALLCSFGFLLTPV